MPEITQAQCNKCGRSTNHDIIASEKLVDRDSRIDSWDLYEMLKCRGCNNVTTRHTSFYSEEGVSEDVDVTIVYYPPAIARRAPEWTNLVYRS